MAQLTLYKSVYLLSGDTYQSITPYGISASTYDESGSVIFETPILGIYKTGVYSASLNGNLYSAGLVYQIKWYIQYTESAPITTITDYFQASLISNPSNPIFIQVMQRPY